jgi:hypothetical protein
VFGSFDSSSSYNLVGVGGGLTNGFNGNIVGVTNPMLGPLANNGGPTQTMALLAGSFALAAGKVSLVPAGTIYDQRGPGYARIVAGSVDIGAYEYQSLVQTGGMLGSFSVNTPATPATLAAMSVTAGSGMVSLGLGDLNFRPGSTATQPLTYTVTAVPDSNVAQIFLADGITRVKANTTYTLAQIQGMQFQPTGSVKAAVTGTFQFTVTDGVATLTETTTITVAPKK